MRSMRRVFGHHHPVSICLQNEVEDVTAGGLIRHQLTGCCARWDFREFAQINA